MPDEKHEREVEWPSPRDDPPEERSHRAGRIADRDRGLELGDVLDDEEEEADDGAQA